MAVVSVLVADSFEPWRRFLVLILKENPNLQIIGVASDGLEAVEKAKRSQPGMIVMDESLPKLNGIDAVRQIHTVAPQCKMLLLSRECNPELARTAFHEGARGYVLKQDLVRDLARGVEAVILGQRFVSHGLAGHDFSDNT